MINNYSHIGFLPGNSLQSSEINEIQERFYLDQTLQSSFLYNWLIFSDDYSPITGRSQDPYTGFVSCLPINPNLVKVYYTETLQIELTSGWYKINNLITQNMSLWAYLPETKILSIDPTESGIYTLALDVVFEEVLCSSNQEDEGYEFNSNVGGYVDSWIPGSNRFKLTIKDAIIKLPSQQNSNDTILFKIRTGIDGIANGRFLVQYMNNYKINDINIS